MSELNIQPIGHFITQPGDHNLSFEVASTGISYIVEGSSLYPDDASALVAYVSDVPGPDPHTRVSFERVLRDANEDRVSIHDENLNPGVPDVDVIDTVTIIKPPIPENVHTTAIDGLVRTLEEIHRQFPQWRPDVLEQG